ncbi:psbQ-like protein 3, chloroplastic [Ricinus communis]|uniref:Calcium ion binding protein, putative n=1 Tax=Ricinus communis TaxID=3988 RepID=B9T0Z7_RICCO|nr:psbQ-like protein 3, chloroplastic [Ricinus communis]XP_048229839.1 psbQ-like protein 3, chloroplastic [Ricinus communis]EEF30460.1 calcium ion binding protein, putative [Ricinus communis]|eukprot:XP_002531916.1 psbQ-like protein 3, chloroplastic [Ricinus communis]
MAVRPLVSNTPTLICCQKPYFEPKEMLPQPNITSRRRIGTVLAAVASAVIAREAISLRPEAAFGFDLRLVAPEPTLEMAESGIRGHAESLLGIKALLESESWPEAQKELRKSSSNLKIDIYTIIQSKPGNERPQLRMLYFDLFNNVTKLDYAARNKDAQRVWQCYGNIVAALDDILGRI